MRKSTTAITLTLLGPALLAAGCKRDCDPNVEDCTRRGGTGAGFYRGGGTTGGGSFIGTSRGGFGSTGGAGHSSFSAGG